MSQALLVELGSATRMLSALPLDAGVDCIQGQGLGHCTATVLLCLPGLSPDAAEPMKQVKPHTTALRQLRSQNGV